MRNNIYIGLIAVILIIMGLVYILTAEPEVVDNDLTEPTNDEVNNHNDEIADPIETLLTQLPQDLEVRGRNIPLEIESLELADREEFAQYPFELEQPDGETRLIEIPVPSEAGENPIAYTDRYLTDQMPPAETLAAYPETLYQYSASFHPTDQGLTLLIQAMNFPDDSVGGSQIRLDYELVDNSWFLSWAGKRTFCRRPTQEYWTPATELCP